MRHASLVLAVALVFVAAACGSNRNTGGQDDAGAQDANHQFDTLQEDVAVQTDVAPQSDAPPPNYDSGQSLVKCGNTFCNLAAGEECCVSGTTMNCAATGSCSGGYGSLACDGPEDCPAAPRRRAAAASGRAAPPRTARARTPAPATAP